MSNPGENDGARWRAKRKAGLVLSVLKGADVAQLCRKHGISQAQLYAWRDRFVEGGNEHLKYRRGRKDPRQREISRPEQKVGQWTVQLEILREVADLKEKK